MEHVRMRHGVASVQNLLRIFVITIFEKFDYVGRDELLQNGWQIWSPLVLCGRKRDTRTL